ncbi:MAG TPA: MoxR family ATPase, partial [Candidatus Paceibacterota bacterium]|nr:MoxR family ATPase [Candidatus Paceibacterota bacterium]
MNNGIAAINEEVQRTGAFLRPLFDEIGKVIIGQKYLVERLVIGLLADGHILLEGVPGLAKTLSVKTLAACLNVKFARLQVSPDRYHGHVVRAAERRARFLQRQNHALRLAADSDVLP